MKPWVQNPRHQNDLIRTIEGPKKHTSNYADQRPSSSCHPYSFADLSPKYKTPLSIGTWTYSWVCITHITCRNPVIMTAAVISQKIKTQVKLPVKVNANKLTQVNQNFTVNFRGLDHQQPNFWTCKITRSSSAAQNTRPCRPLNKNGGCSKAEWMQS